MHEKRIALFTFRGIERRIFRQNAYDLRKLIFQSSRQDEKAHRFDQPYALFFDVVVFGMGVENAVRIFFACNIIS